MNTGPNTDINDATRSGYTLGPVVSGPECCTPEAVIAVRGLDVTYDGVAALKDVSLDIYKGCVTALIGPSGCGKSTFLSSLNRLTDMSSGCRVSGSITVDGWNIHAPEVNVQELRRKVGMIFQRPNPFPFSVRRNLDMPLREHGISNRYEREERIETALIDVGLWDEVRDRLDASALSLSGGQQQRLCIARALILKPSILLMDEPCSALDPLSSATVESMVGNLRGRYTVVVVTHNLAQARRIANYAAFFWVKDRAGALIEYDTCGRLFETPKHKLTAAYVTGIAG